METIKAFCKRKNIEVSAKRYGIDALGAMAQGLFCSLLIGTIIKTLGVQLSVPFLTDIGTYAMSVSGPAMAVAIGYALKADPMVLFSLAAVGWAANAEGGAGGPLAVLIIAIVAAECGKAVSKETKIDILVTPAVTILVGVALAKWIAPPIGTAASAFGLVIDNATRLQPFWMGIAVSVLVGIALTLPISSAAICQVLRLTGIAGGAAVSMYLIRSDLTTGIGLGVLLMYLGSVAFVGFCYAAAAQLKTLGFTVLPSKANFLFAKTDKMDGLELYQTLKAKGILVRHFTSPRICQFNRITIGTPAQMAVLVETLQEVLP